MKSYTAMFKMRFIAGMQYRAAAWAGIATQFFWGFMLIMIYHAFYNSSSSNPPMEFSRLVSFIWLQQAFLALNAFWIQDGELLNSISEGGVAYELCKPYDLYSFWFARLLANRFCAAMLRFLPILAFSFFLPQPYTMSLPHSQISLVLTIIALLFATLLVVAISMFIYIFTFMTLSAAGIQFLITILAEFLSGHSIPIPFMPKVMQNILNVLPFRYTVDFPFRIYSGDIMFTDAILGIVIQLFWLLTLLIIGRISFNKVTAKIVVQGG